MPKDRRHSAIMFTDIVGYTSLMGSDEDRAFEVLAKNREIHLKLIEKFNGTLIKEMGDGMLISFDLASEAVRCAIEIQKACKNQDIPLKIGIHEGEMVFEKNDVLGDGVNIASRLESETQSGCILISGSVYQDVRNKSDIQTRFLREKHLKNVSEKIKVYQVLCGDESDQLQLANKYQPTGKSTIVYYLLTGLVLIVLAIFFVWKIFPPRDKAEPAKSIAVLPLKNLSADPDSKVLSGGITEELITHLANIQGLKVKSRYTSLSIENDSLEFEEIAKKYNVMYILEGTIHKTGDMINITLGLIDVVTDTYLWQKPFSKKHDVIMEIPGEVTKKIVESLNVTISAVEKERIKLRITNNFTAYDYYLRAVHEDRNWTVDGSIKTMEYLEKAIELDPEFSEAYSLYAWQLVQLSVSYPVMSTQEALKKALPAAQMAIKYDSLSSDAYIILAAVYYNLKWDFKKAEESFMKSLEYNAWGEAPIYQCYCIIVEYLISNNRLHEAQDIIRNINSNNPTVFMENAYLGIMQFGQGNYEAAIKLIEKQLHYSETWILYSLLGIAYHLQGDYDEALNKLQIGLSMTERRPGKILSRMAMAYYRMEQHKEAFEILVEMLDRHQEGEFGLAFPIALIYNEMEDEENTFKWLDIYYENHEAYMLYLGFIDFQNLRNHPRFIELLNKIGFEV